MGYGIWVCLGMYFHVCCRCVVLFASYSLICVLIFGCVDLDVVSFRLLAFCGCRLVGLIVYGVCLVYYPVYGFVRVIWLWFFGF